MPIESVVIKANPVTAWEQFTLSLDREQLLQPRTKHRDLGGFWSSSFQIYTDLATRALASDFLANGIMRHVEMYDEKGTLDWEGFVNKVVVNTGTTKIQANREDMANKIFVRYNDAGTVKRSTTITNTDSSGRYGIKERVLVGGEVSLGVADQHAQQVIDWIGWPSPAVREINLGGRVLDRPSLEISCLGYWHTLSDRVYNQTALTTDADLSVVIANIITAVGEFIASTDIDDNTTQIAQEYDADRAGGDIIQSALALGDGAFHRWVGGVGPGRIFYAKQAAKPER